MNGSIVERSAIVKYLGAWFDENLNMKELRTKQWRASMINIQRIKLIHSYLTEDSVKTLMMGLVVSHLDYCNTVVAGLPDIDIKRMQRVQNIAAKMILQRGKMDSSTQCLKELHWLLITCRVKHKILTLVHKCFQGSAPRYLQELLSAAECRHDGLRSESDTRKLFVPLVKRKTFAERSFAIQGPKLWNSLPLELRSITNTDNFKKQLKTHLFSNF